MMTHPELPHNLEAERAVLGSVLMNREAIIALAPHLKAEHFYYERHARIYTAMLDLFGQRVPTDTRTVFNELKARGYADDVGGIPYLSDLVDSVPTAYHVEYYAVPVIEAAERRALIDACGQGAAIGYDETLSVQEAQARVQTLITQATAGGRENDVASAATVMDEVWDDLSRDTAPAIPTGFYDLDDLSGGFYPGELVLIAARPSVGKTAMALSLTYNITGRRDPAHLLFFSAEMSRLQLGQRLAAMDTGVDLRAIRQRRVTEDERRAISEAAGKIAEWPFDVCDVAKQTPASLRARVMRAIAEHPQLVVVVDYLQLLESGKKTHNRVEEMGEISRQLKILARDANVPVIALCQLSRAVEGRQDQRPILSDLRESGSLEQDADVVMFLYRPHVEREDGTRTRATETQLLIEKARNGPVGVVGLQFQPETTRFVSPERYRDVSGY